jgi:hypothetical protein
LIAIRELSIIATCISFILLIPIVSWYVEQYPKQAANIEHISANTASTFAEAVILVLKGVIYAVFGIIFVMALLMAVNGSSGLYTTLRPQNFCGGCGYSWYPRGSNYSRRCPRCGVAR